MRKLPVILLLALALTCPLSAQAQTSIKLASFQAQLWPEYDQPSMLVIYDFKLPEDVKLPVNISIRFPRDGNLVAVAEDRTGSLVNTDYVGPTLTDTWQVVTLQIQNQTTYHLEYYEPLVKSGEQRQFTYLWPGDYAVDDLGVSVRVPIDTLNMTTDPIMKSTQNSDGSDVLVKDFGAVQSGQQLMLQINYVKSSDKLSITKENVQPTAPLGSDTPGRVTLSNYIPYILWVLGIVLVGGAAVFFWQARQGRSFAGRRRHAGRAERAAKSDVYCHQCGARAQPGDRFCRVCGTRLRLSE